eukprot:384903-Alexandrium_andersonii.AAC.1
MGRAIATCAPFAGHPGATAALGALPEGPVAATAPPWPLALPPPSLRWVASPKHVPLPASSARA